MLEVEDLVATSRRSGQAALRRLEVAVAGLEERQPGFRVVAGSQGLTRRE